MGLLVYSRLKNEERSANKLTMEAVDLHYQLTNIHKRELQENENYRQFLLAEMNEISQSYNEDLGLIVIDYSRKQEKRSKEKNLAIMFTNTKDSPLSDSKIA